MPKTFKLTPLDRPKSPLATYTFDSLAVEAAIQAKNVDLLKELRSILHKMSEAIAKDDENLYVALNALENTTDAVDAESSSGHGLENVAHVQAPSYLRVSNNVEVQDENFVLKGDQPKAYEDIVSWLNSTDSYHMFALMGGAGSGKSNLLRYLVSTLSKTHNIILTATTNAACKTLANILKIPVPDVKTIYSHLGLSIEEEEDELVLRRSPHYRKKDYAHNDILVIDEGGMAPKVVVDYLVEMTGIKILLVGDPFQLPPVKEKVSKAFSLCRSQESFTLMKQILRFDDAKLKLALKLRRAIKNRDLDTSTIISDEGIVRHYNTRDFALSITMHLEEFGVDGMGESKILAWRNKTVVKYNELVRRYLGMTEPMSVGERLLLAEPLSRGDEILAAVDSRMKIEESTTGVVRIILDAVGETVRIPVHSLVLSGDYSGVLDVVQDMSELEVILGELSARAKGSVGTARKKAWADFWKVKKRFPKVLYDYACTVHRAQGASLDTVWVDSADILANSKPEEGLKCLYVACSRPKGTLHYI